MIPSMRPLCTFTVANRLATNTDIFPQVDILAKGQDKER